MNKILKIINSIFPFNNTFKNILFYLCLSPIINYILINIYYYNCGGYINNLYDIFNIINPFSTSNPLCVVLITLISYNIYLVQYIYLFIFLFIISLLN